jgi:hypothetical protein
LDTAVLLLNNEAKSDAVPFRSSYGKPEGHIICMFHYKKKMLKMQDAWQ